MSEVDFDWNEFPSLGDIIDTKVTNLITLLRLIQFVSNANWRRTNLKTAQTKFLAINNEHTKM